MTINYAQSLKAGFLGVFTVPFKKKVIVASRDVLSRASTLVMRVLNHSQDMMRTHANEFSFQPTGRATSGLSIMRRPYRQLPAVETPLLA
jgi:hypothetical protein